jgi:hypothetical protein
MAGATQHRQPRPPRSSPAPYEPTQDDLAQMAKVHSIHDVLDQCPELPLDVRLGLLDHAWLLLGGNGQPHPRLGIPPDPLNEAGRPVGEDPGRPYQQHDGAPHRWRQPP